MPMPASIRRHNERDKSEAAQDDTDDEDHFPDRVPTIAPFNSMHGRATQSKGRRQTQSTRPNMIILPFLLSQGSCVNARCSVQKKVIGSHNTVIVLSKAHAFPDNTYRSLYKWIFLVLPGLRIAMRITRLRDRDKVSFLEAFIFS